MHSADLRRARGGFTLVELMVALLISSVIVAVVFQLLNSQTRFVAVQGGREEAQQNARGALEIVAGELRGAFPAGLVAGDAQSLTFMQPRLWGIVCGGAASTVDLLVPVTGAVDQLVDGAGTGILFNTAAPGTAATWNPDPANPVVPRAVVTSATLLGAGAQGNCVGRGAAGNVQTVQVTSNQAIAAMTAPDQTAVLYSLTTYQMGVADGRTWLQRSFGTGAFNPQPLAGPLRDGHGFRLAYFAGTPAAEVNVAGNPALLRTVRMVQVQVVSESRSRLDGRVQSDSGVVTVMLRNWQ